MESVSGAGDLESGSGNRIDSNHGQFIVMGLDSWAGAGPRVIVRRPRRRVGDAAPDVLCVLL